MIEIGDGNYREFVDQHLQRADGVVGALPRKVPLGNLACARPYADSGAPMIPQAEWADRIRAMEAAKAWAADVKASTGAKDLDQDGLPYCWAYSLTDCVETVRATQGLPYVELAPESLGGCVNYRSVGNSLDDALAWAAKHGIAPRSLVPAHNLRVQSWGAEWQKQAANHVPLEWWDLGAKSMWGETVSVLLTGGVVYAGYDWWGHAVKLDKLVLVGSEVCVSGPNSWGANQRFVLKGNRKMPSLGCFAPRSVSFSNA